MIADYSVFARILGAGVQLGRQLPVVIVVGAARARTGERVALQAAATAAVQQLGRSAHQRHVGLELDAEAKGLRMVVRQRLQKCDWTEVTFYGQPHPSGEDRLLEFVAANPREDVPDAL